MMDDPDDLWEFCESIMSDPTVQSHNRWVAATYAGDPAEVLIDNVRDGLVSEWRGGKIARVSDEQYRALWVFRDLNALSFDFGCVMVTPGFHYIIRIDKEPAP